MDNVFLNGSIHVEMGTGNDTVTLGHEDVVSTKGDLNVDLGAGNDVLNGRRIFIARDQNLVLK
jgi:Ca2+-binding RTX toxin-like protein